MPSTDGVVSIDYDTVESSAVAGQDFVANSGTLTFADGETSKTITIVILDNDIQEPDEQFGITIDNLVGEATLLAPRTATVTIDDNDTVQSAGDGLLGEYFRNDNLTDRAFTRVDSTVNFDWATSSPDARLGVDKFSVRWTGQIEARYNELYTFTTRSDDGVRLYVDGQLVIDQWNDHAATNHTGSIQLEAGVLYDIRIEYYENTGAAVMQLNWSSASQGFQAVPTSQLYAADPPANPGLNLTDQTVVSGLTAPTSIAFSEDGQNLYIALKSGEVRLVRDGNLVATPFIDISAIVNNTRDRGLLDIELHPDFENNPYVYLLFTYDPPEVFDNIGNNLAGPDQNGNRAGRLIRVTADASNGYQTAIAGSEVVLLGQNSTWDNFNAFANSTFDFTEPPASCTLATLVGPTGKRLIRRMPAPTLAGHTTKAAVERAPEPIAIRICRKPLRFITVANR